MYFKVTNYNETHHGYQYHDGLNELIDEFNDDCHASCVPGGFYITTEEHIDQFYDYGVNLRIVELPINDPSFKIVKDPEENKWRVNKLILKEKFSFYDPYSFIKNKIPMISMDYASQIKALSILDWWKNSGLECVYSRPLLIWRLFMAISIVVLNIHIQDHY